MDEQYLRNTVHSDWTVCTSMFFRELYTSSSYVTLCNKPLLQTVTLHCPTYPGLSFLELLTYYGLPCLGPGYCSLFSLSDYQSLSVIIGHWTVIAWTSIPSYHERAEHWALPTPHKRLPTMHCLHMLDCHTLGFLIYLELPYLWQSRLNHHTPEY
jgi:hypothetical protein